MSMSDFDRILINNEKLEAKKDMELRINTEMIDYQKDDIFINSLTKAIDDIYVALDIAKVKNPTDQCSKFLRNEALLKAVKNFEKVTSDRFGLEIILGTNDFVNAFTFPCGGLLLDNFFDWVDWNQVDAICTEYESVLSKSNPKDVEDYDKDPERYFNKHMLPYDLVKYNMLKDEGISFDLSKAKILNAKNGFRWYINADFYSFRDLGVTPKECAAILLHELGHAWTWTEYNYKTYRDIQILQDVIREEYGKKNKSLAETISVYYVKQGMKKKPSGKTDTELFINTTRDILDRNKTRGLFLAHTSSLHEFTDSEQQADEFASRFGLGVELVQALEKIGASYLYDRYSFLGGELALTAFTLVGVVGSIIASSIFGLAVFSFFALLNVFGLKYALDGSMYGDCLRTYDDYDSRIKRLKHSTKRRLKCIEDVKTKEAVIKQIETIDKQLKAVESMKNKSFINKIFMYFNSKTEEYKEYRFEEIVEELLSNDLHYIADKFKLLRR